MMPQNLSNSLDAIQIVFIIDYAFTLLIKGQ